MTIHALPAQRVSRGDDTTPRAARMVVSDGVPARRLAIRHPWVRSDDRRAA